MLVKLLESVKGLGSELESVRVLGLGLEIFKGLG